LFDASSMTGLGPNYAPNRVPESRGLYPPFVQESSHFQGSYGSADRPLKRLKHVSARIGKGKSVAIVGKSGSGKFTLMDAGEV
jgi:ABC-type multidrug transport system fused ATPase/permease subunit